MPAKCQEYETCADRSRTRADRGVTAPTVWPSFGQRRLTMGDQAGAFIVPVVRPRTRPWARRYAASVGRLVSTCRQNNKVHLARLRLQLPAANERSLMHPPRHPDRMSSIKNAEHCGQGAP